MAFISTALTLYHGYKVLKKLAGWFKGGDGNPADADRSPASEADNGQEGFAADAEPGFDFGIDDLL
jgi:hypothetical protein